MKKEKSKNKSLKDQNKPFRQSNKQAKNFNYGNLLGLAIIVILGSIIYSNTFIGPFQFDDSFNIVDNKAIRSITDLAPLWEYNPRRIVGLYTFALNYHFDGLNVWGYHLVNLIIHLITACLVWWFALLIFSSPVLRNHPVSRHKNFIAFFTALLFVSHPLATQSVTYIVQRSNSMAAMFYLFSLVLYVKARLLGKWSITRSIFFGGALIFAILAMFTKENAYTLPFAVLVLEIFFLQTRKITINFKDYRVILATAAALGVTLLLLLKVSSSVFDPIPPSLGNPYTVTPVNYFLTQFSVIVKYIQLLFLPVNQNLDYDFPLSNHFFEVRTILSFLFLLSLIVLAIYFFRKNRVISFGIFWFFLTLSVESSFLPITDVIFEHRTYLPSVGFCLILSSGIVALLWDKYKFPAIVLLLVIAGANAFRTFERNKVWKDEITLWNDVVSKSPNKARPIATRGDSYRNLGRWKEAIAEYSGAIKLNPEYSTSYHNRAGVYGKLGQWDKAIADYSNAIRIDSTYKLAFYNRGNAYSTILQWEKAIADFSSAIQLDPEFTFAYYARSVAYGKVSQWDKVVADCTNAIRIDPTYIPAFVSRGLAYYNLRQWDKAIADYTTAIEADATYSTLFGSRGVAHGNLGQWDKAVVDYTRAIQVNPNDANMYFNQGVAYGNLKQWDKAITSYSKAIELDPNMRNAIINRDNARQRL